MITYKICVILLSFTAPSRARLVAYEFLRTRCKNITRLTLRRKITIVMMDSLESASRVHVEMNYLYYYYIISRKTHYSVLGQLGLTRVFIFLAFFLFCFAESKLFLLFRHRHKSAVELNGRLLI